MAKKRLKARRSGRKVRKIKTAKSTAKTNSKSSKGKTRLTPEQVVAELAQESQSSVELSRDAKGVPRWNIKVYGNNDWASLQRIQKRVLKLDKMMQNATMG